MNRELPGRNRRGWQQTLSAVASRFVGLTGVYTPSIVAQFRTLPPYLAMLFIDTLNGYVR